VDIRPYRNKKISADREGYTHLDSKLSWIPELEPYFSAEKVATIPVQSGVVPEYYKRFLPSDGTLYRLTPKETKERVEGRQP